MQTEGSTIRSRTIEYQSDLLQKFQKEAMPKLLGECSSGERYDLVIHKVYPWQKIVGAWSLARRAD